MALGTLAFLDALGLEQADVLGFSIGSFVAQDITLTKQPPRRSSADCRKRTLGVTICGSAAGTDVGHRRGLIAEPMATAAPRQTQWSVSGRWRRVGAAARMPKPTARPKISSVTFGLR